MLNEALKQQILAILFAAREPVELAQLVEVFETLSLEGFMKRP